MRTAGLLVVELAAGAYLPSPLYPGYQRLFGFDDSVMTLLFATFALVSGAALLLCGPAAEAVGLRPALRLSVLPAAGSGCFVLADGPAWLFAGRVGQALALGAATGAASLPAALGSALLAGAGHGLAFSGATGAVYARTPAGQRAGTGAALYLLFYLGSGTPAVAIGLMADWMPLPTAVAGLSWAAAALGVFALSATFGGAVREVREAREVRGGEGQDRAGGPSGVDNEVLPWC
ncbi:hypothetical protein [Streptomyces axinellae]|uniref:hypothetical protein n=1 Tax=Streptomyces axinellae TaxID=552788 RepID=UPI0031D31318